MSVNNRYIIKLVVSMLVLFNEELFMEHSIRIEHTINGKKIMFTSLKTLKK